MSRQTDNGDNFFLSHTAGELAADKTSTIDVEECTTLDKVLEILAKNNIRAVPVYRTEGHHKLYTGIVSSFDIVFYVALEIYYRDSESSSPAAKGNLFSAYGFARTAVGEIVGKISLEGKSVWTFEATDNLVKVAEYFSKGIHRALVGQREDATGKRVYRLVSQTDLVRFIVRNQESITNLKSTKCPKGLLQMPLEELGLVHPDGGSKVLDIKEDQIALEGFHTMEMEGVHALPVVDSEGRIISTLSTADIYGLDSTNLQQTLSPVGEFLKATHKDQMLHPVTCKSRDTLLNVLTKMNAAEVHRHQVWVINSEEKVVGVVSMTDAIRTIYEAL